MDGVALEKVLKIKELMENYGEYRFTRKIEEMNEKQLDYVLRALESGKIEGLKERKVMLPVFRYLVSADADIWSYITFKEVVNGKQIDYNTDGTHVLWQIWEVPEEIPKELAKKHGFSVELLSTL